MCLMCVHYVPKTESPVGRPTCPAFPNGIPQNIFHGPDDWFIPDPHLEPVEGQIGDTVFTLDPELPDNYPAIWDDIREKMLVSRERARAGIPGGLDVDGEQMDPNRPYEDPQ